MPARRNTPSALEQRIALQRQNMQAAASGAPIQLRDATLGAYVPGGPAYGAKRDGRQVLVQRNAAGTGANLAGSVNFGGQTLDPLTVGKDVIWVPRGGSPTEIENRYGIGAAQPSKLPAPSPKPAPSSPPVLSDDADARASEARRMLQQATPYWEREENQGIRTAAALGGGPRAGETGYAQRADIQAWMEANKNAPKGADGKNIVDRFLEQQQKRGLLDVSGQGSPAFGGERIAMPADSESAVQAGTRGLVGYEGNALAQAQANVSELQGRERAALTQKIFQAAAQGELPDFAVSVPKNIDVAFNRSAGIPVGAEAFTGLEVGQPFTNPEMNRQLASLGQPAAVQAVATGTGSGATLQPSSAAASEAGVEPAQPDAPGNKPNPADDLARRYIDNLRTTRAARLGY